MKKRKSTLSNFFLEEEIKSLKILIAFYLLFIFAAIAGFFLSRLAGEIIMKNWQFGIIIISGLLSIISGAGIVYLKKGVFETKYFLAGIMSGTVTLAILWTGSVWLFLGYYLLLAMTGLFYDWKVSLFTGLFSFLLFLFLFFQTTLFQIEEAIIWTVYFLPMVAVITFLNRRNSILIKELFGKRQELEEIRSVLEIRISARTKELRLLAESLEEQVEQRTRELEKKIKQLEKFQKLVVGREMKMIELKKEIQKLKATSQKK
jgi:hypothetical protein